MVKEEEEDEIAFDTPQWKDYIEREKVPAVSHYLSTAKHIPKQL